MADARRQQFGKYELGARIATGGMAEIFKARFSPTPGLTKEVVIKRILAHYAADPAFIEMFTNEAKIVLRLTHGNIAQVFDFGQIKGDWFLAMELVDGASLAAVTERARAFAIHRMPVPFALLIVREMLRGLHYAHTRLDEQGQPLKIVHRDVSPQNVLLTWGGEVKVVDFGIARARLAGREETEAGKVKGKFHYFAPEQAKAQPLDARTDVFAAGVVLYELLCGVRPFDGNPSQALRAIVRGEFAAPRAVNPELTPALEQIVLTALATEPGDRYPSAEAFSQALSGYLNQNAPTFAPSSLASLMGLLFEAELTTEGRPPKLTRDFLDQVSLWKSAAPAPELPLTRGPPVAPASTRRWLLVGALPAALLVLGAGLWVGTRGEEDFSVQLTSEPDHAVVRVAGRSETVVTPTRVTGLHAARGYTLTLTVPGYLPAELTVQGHPGELLEQGVKLTRQPAPAAVATDTAAAPEDAGAQDAGPPALAEVPTVGSFPISHFTLDAKQHAFVVPGSHAVKVPLDPKRAYRVWTEGKVSWGGYFNSIFDQCAYFLEGPPSLRSREAYGVVGPKPITIRNASALHAFFGDDSPSDNTGALKLHLVDSAGHATVVDVEARYNTAVPDDAHQFKVIRLEPLATYELTLRDGTRPARTRGERGGPARRVFFSEAPGLGMIFEGKPLSNDAQRVLEVGKPARFFGTPWIVLAFPDDDVADNDGTLEVELTTVTVRGLRLDLLKP